LKSIDTDVYGNMLLYKLLLNIEFFEKIKENNEFFEKIKENNEFLSKTIQPERDK